LGEKPIHVHLEVFATDGVVGADQPLVEITNGGIRRRRHNRLRTFQMGSQRLAARDVLEPGVL
jgi:hypothetical protein